MSEYLSHSPPDGIARPRGSCSAVIDIPGASSPSNTDSGCLSRPCSCGCSCNKCFCRGFVDIVRITANPAVSRREGTPISVTSVGSRCPYLNSLSRSFHAPDPNANLTVAPPSLDALRIVHQGLGPAQLSRQNVSHFIGDNASETSRCPWPDYLENSPRTSALGEDSAIFPLELDEPRSNKASASVSARSISAAARSEMGTSDVIRGVGEGLNRNSFLQLN
jgi:hypothetical protein